MSDKFTKLLIVIFLTLMIWAWAFLSQEKEDSFHGTLVLSNQTDPSLLVTFSADGVQYGNRVPLKLNFIGTPAKIAELSQRARLTMRNDQNQERLDYPYNPADDGFMQDKTYTFDLLRFLQEHSKTRGLNLTLQSCEIANKPITQIEVNVEVLERKLCKIVCFDENNQPVPSVDVTPARIEMYVRKDAPAEARITLSGEELDRARTQPVSATPFVDLGVPGLRPAEQTVQVSIAESSGLKSKPFNTSLPIGVIMSQTLQNEYKVEIDDESELKARSKIDIMVTDEAYTAYQNSSYPLLIEIRDSDKTSTEEWLLKNIIYNFPVEYVRSGQIRLADPAAAKTRQVKVKLIPVAAPTP